MNKKAIISLITKEEEFKYNETISIKNNKINYKEEGITDVFYDIKKEILIRDNKDIYMEYNFSTNKATVYIKELKKVINLNLIKKELIVTDKLIDILYLLDDKECRYIIDMEEEK